VNRWRPCGYPTPSAFSGAWFCRFRLCHQRDDGLEVVTLGHQVERGGRLSPIMPGFNFVTWVMRTDSDGEVKELERAACNDARTATAQHMALLLAHDEKEIGS
jgi:hypothetical protein